MLDLVAELGRDVVDVAHAHPRRILERNADHLLVEALLVGHVEDADDAHADPAAGERRLADENERVERVAVLPHRSLDEAVVGRIAHRREEPSVEDDPPELLVQLVLVPRARRDLDEDDDVAHGSLPIRSTSRSKNPSVSRSTPTCAFGGSLRAPPEVDDRAAATELRVELDLDVAVDRRHEPGSDHVRDRDGIVDRRAVPAVRLAVVDGEEVDEVGDERPDRARGAQPLLTSAGVVTARCVTSSPIIVVVDAGVGRRPARPRGRPRC